MSAADTAARAWGAPLPEWVAALAAEADRVGQKRAAERIGYSTAVVNTVLQAKYRGDLGAVEKAVRGGLLSATVDCPVLGALAGNRCLEIQRQPAAATNALRVRLWRACRAGCPHSRLGSGR